MKAWKLIFLFGFMFLPQKYKCQPCHQNLYPPHYSFPLTLIHPGHSQIKPPEWSRKAQSIGAWAQNSGLGTGAEDSSNDSKYALTRLSLSLSSFLPESPYTSDFL